MRVEELIYSRAPGNMKANRSSCHIFYSRRCVDVVDGLPKFAKHKDESETIPETLKEEGHND
jgi:hypothetical protein